MLLDCSHLPLIGGKEIVVHHLAMSYLELGHEVILVGPGGFRRFYKYRYPYKLVRWPSIPLLPKEIGWQLMLVIAHLRFKCDLIHSHTTYPNGYTAAKLKNFFASPLVITAHGEDIHKVPEIGFGIRIDPNIDRKVKYALTKADAATAISKAVELSLKDAGIEQSKIFPIPNGVDKIRFSTPVDFDIFAYLSIPKDSKLVISVGNYHIRKGHEVLVESVKKALESEPRLKLVLVGKQSPSFCQEVINQGLEKHVKFTGSLKFPVPGEDAGPDVLVALLHASIAYVSSSIAEGTEGLSLAILEAMASATCVIATDVSGSRDIIVSEQNGILVKPQSSDDLAEALVRIATDGTLRVTLAREGQKSVEKYSWISIAKQYINLYEKLLASSP